MLYNIIKHVNSEKQVIDVLEIEEGISKSKFRECLINFYNSKFDKKLKYLRFEKMRHSNSYLILGNRGRLLFTMEEKPGTLWSRVWNVLTKPIGELF